jgi:protein tyrosine phosphatase (PTP) superfamily phosphohydrolase (DUF442 family)
MADDSVADIVHLREVDGSLLTAGQPTAVQWSSVARRGFEVVIDLAPSNAPAALADEAACVAALGMEHVHIPVPLAAPTEAGLQSFLDAMEANRTRRVLVHCAANKRVTAVLGLYRVLRLGWPIKETFALMRTVWESDAVWSRFLAAALERHRA